MDQGGTGMGRALRRAMGHEEIPKRPSIQTAHSSVLMNRVRQQMFRNLCKYPCSNLRGIARLNKVSAPTASWHVKKMEEQGLLERHKSKNRVLSSPSSYVLEKDVHALHALNEKKTLHLASLIVGEPGLTQSELYKGMGLYQQAVLRPTEGLQELGLIIIESDARTRYYPTESFNEMWEGFRDRSETFISWIKDRLEEDGVKPRLKRRYAERISIQFSVGAKKKTMRLNTVPEPLLMLMKRRRSR